MVELNNIIKVVKMNLTYRLRKEVFDYTEGEELP